jgi:ribonuclease Y
MTIILIVVAAAFGAAGVFLGRFLTREEDRKNLANAKDEAERIRQEAEKNAETLKRERLLEAKDEILKLRSQLDKDREERRQELQRQEKRIQQKEENIDRKQEQIEKRERSLTNKENEIAKIREQSLQLQAQQREELERIAKLTTDEAKNLLLASLERELQHEMAVRIKHMEERIKEEADAKARMIIGLAIQRWSADQVVEATVSVVPLPSDEMKGRIIGREGRNIRMLETLTGVDLIIDDTPEAVILSGFDPVRREVARMALEKLVIDGRIHPARIEEIVEKSQKEIESRIWQEGEQVCFEAGVTGVHPEIIKLLGRLKYRTSYGQNVLRHSLEVATLAGAIAAELGTDVRLAKRAGLLHDIGKAIDSEVEGPHALIGAKFAEKYHESKEVVHAIAAHHEDEEQKTLEAVLIQACDTISAARPGARRETLEAYIKRLEKLEKVANSFEGVEKSFAIQAGREVRILVKPELVDDVTAFKLAREIVSKIEKELEYPGQIKVTVIRETRAVEYAK